MNGNKLRSISLFSGYGGIAIGLHQYSEPILYCDIEPYAQATLLSRMDDGTIPVAPIWNDVTTLNGVPFRGLVDLIEGGFPCQDISVAGKGAGLDGERSGLFREIIRLCKEASPSFLFLENVPAIRTRGSIEVQEALASIGYDARWGVISAAEVGANHRRERWFCLAKRRSESDFAIRPKHGHKDHKYDPECSHCQPWTTVADTSSEGLEGQWEPQRIPEEESRVNCNAIAVAKRNLAHAECSGLQGLSISEAHVLQPTEGSSKVPNTHLSRLSGETSSATEENNEGIGEDYWRSVSATLERDWWKTEPRVGRVAHGTVARAHRIKALGNGVVPLQVKTAFEVLAGIK